MMGKGTGTFHLKVSLLNSLDRKANTKKNSAQESSKLHPHAKHEACFVNGVLSTARPVRLHSVYDALELQQQNWVLGTDSRWPSHRKYLSGPLRKSLPTRRYSPPGSPVSLHSGGTCKEHLCALVPSGPLY